MHQPDVHPFDWIPPTIRTLVPAGEQVGVEADAHFFSPRAYLALDRGLPANRLVDSAELVNWVRVVKSPFEVGQLRIAGTIVERAMRAALDDVRAGPTAVRRRRRDPGRAGHRNPGTRRRLPRDRADAADRQAAGTPHLTWTDRALPRGRSHHHRAGRCLRPLPRAAGADRDARRPAAPAHRDREGDRRGHGRRRWPRCGPASTCDAVHQAFDRVIRPHGMEKESRHRLLDRHRLPARLG